MNVNIYEYIIFIIFNELNQFFSSMSLGNCPGTTVIMKKWMNKLNI